MAVLCRACALLFYVAGAQRASSQQPSLRGTVVSAETGQPLGYSIVELQPGLGQQFTTASGAFAFSALQPGTYLLTVRQIAYTPVDTQIVLREDGETVVRVALRHLAIELPAVTVAATQCTTPGPPEPSDTALRAVFDQLQENSRHYELLADSYPFRYALEISERTVNQRGDTGKPEIRRLRFYSSDYHPYAVGRVVEPAWGPWGDPENTLVIHSAELQDLGNPRFIANHCFRLVGLDTIAGDTLVRVDFEPAKHLGSPDMAGAAYLDPTTYELRYTVTSLTRPERSSLTDVRSMSFRTSFRNIAPGVPLQDSLTAITIYRYGQRAKIDTQRTTDVRFTRQAPHP
ncbi:MAG TPA: carboxypeptidase regulatory-like domain-containing protein [Gemmatimonadales bacterium]|nr:carboxypeptidase regulatory-like domain-containing protein [Gemmatimonadales bacterium]